jgi:coenzyme F420-0:L-glutamate ligase/coenzyme F420-1:gamma-L-glutamate ligase
MRAMPASVTLLGIDGLPEFAEGDDIGALLVQACAAQATALTAGDVLVVTQKIVSKAEGRVVDLNTITPSALAVDFASRWDKDARTVEVVLSESVRVVRMEKGVMITETRHGFVCANSGVDASNVGTGSVDFVVLLPEDSDASARRIRDRVRELVDIDVPVIVSDTFGRPWREGAGDVAIGVAGLEPLWDYRGKHDNDGRELHSTVIAVADELAAASELVTNKLTRVPAAIIRGYPYKPGESGIAPMIRERDKDLFR